MGSCRGAVDCTNRSRDRKGPEPRSLVTGEKEQVDDGRRGERQPPAKDRITDTRASKQLRGLSARLAVPLSDPDAIAERHSSRQFSENRA